jgi:hypothetical protein
MTSPIGSACYSCGEFDADSAVADEAAGLVEHRLAAHLNFCCEPSALTRLKTKSRKGCRAAMVACSAPAPPHSSPSPATACISASASTRIPSISRTGPETLVKFRSRPAPSTSRGELGQAAIAGFAFAQLGGAFLHRLFQHLVVVLELLVQQPHFQHVVDARLDFDQVERLADEILAPACSARSLWPGWAVITRTGR